MNIFIGRYPPSFTRLTACFRRQPDVDDDDDSDEVCRLSGVIDTVLVCRLQDSGGN